MRPPFGRHRKIYPIGRMREIVGTTDTKVKDNEVNDEIYGRFALDSHLLVDLISSEGVQRMRGMGQAGAASLIRPGRDVTRFGHSVGVMLLTRIIGGSECEQAAGLLQDVSHTAFSHTADHLYGDRNERFHERIFPFVMSRIDIPTVLHKHGLTSEEVFAAENLRRVNAPAPLLCADRIDYTLRDLTRFGHITTRQARDFVSRLSFVNGVVVVQDAESAAQFAEWYEYLVLHLYMDPLELYANDELAKILRHGLETGVLIPDDLLGVDADVLAKLHADIEHGLHRRLSIFEHTTTVVEGDGPYSRRVYSKPRVIDPPVLVDGYVVPLSQTDHGGNWTGQRSSRGPTMALRFRLFCELVVKLV